MGQIQLLQFKYFSLKLFWLRSKIKTNVAIDGKIQLLEFYFFCEITLNSKYMTFLKIRFRQNIRQIEVISALLS